MGQFNASGDLVPQSIANVNPGSWSSPAWWNDTLYLGGAAEPPTVIPDSLRAFTFDPISGTLTTWVLQENNYQNIKGQAVLFAYDATNLANLLYSSSQNSTRDNAGVSVKFGVPTIANGKVIIPGRNAVTVFGLLP